jgi:hypothetical protein
MVRRSKKPVAALSDAQPEGIRYASYLFPDGKTFVALTQLDASLRSFYAEDPRRALSPERDLGLHWRARDGSSYRVAYVDATGEIYSVRHGSPRDESRVTVIARVAPDALYSGLAGWHEMCDSERPGSYEWLCARAVAAEKWSRRKPEHAQRGRARRATRPGPFSPFPF